MITLVTGAAGFIGYHCARHLLERGEHVVGLDNLNRYYDPQLKRDRLARLETHDRFTGIVADLQDKAALQRLFDEHRPDRVLHLAAQAGVRYSLIDPDAYVGANLVGFANLLELCRGRDLRHLVFASTSSVYGANRALPFMESQATAHPLTLYAATKIANEAMAHAYSHLFDFPVSGLRFFTVYGPWGRPDMALFRFTKAILAGEEIEVYNHGDASRDFTYIDDVVAGVLALLDLPPARDPAWNAETPDPASSGVAPYRLYNIGRNQPVPLMDFIHAIEAATGKTARLKKLPMQPGDVKDTWASVARLEAATGYTPQISVDEGVRRFVAWYREYYGL